MSDDDSSPSSIASSSSRFPLTYLRVLDGLPLPERYLIRDDKDDVTISEISIPTQTQTRTDATQDDDTDLDASDFDDDEVSDFNGTLKGSEEGSQETVFWKDKVGSMVDVRNSNSTGSLRDQSQTSKSSDSSQRSVISQVDTDNRTKATVDTRQGSQSPEIFSEGFKLRRKVRPRPQVRGSGKDTEEGSRKANIGYGASRSESLPTAHVFPSPAFPVSASSTIPASSAASKISWNIPGGANTTSTNFEALNEDHDLTYLSPNYGDFTGDGGGGVKSYISDTGNINKYHHMQPSSLGSTLTSTYHHPTSVSIAGPSSSGGGGIYDHNLYGGDTGLSATSHHRSQRGTSPSSYLPAGYTGWSSRTAVGEFDRPVTAPVVDDVTQWQQRHQEQLRRQKLEYADPLHVGSLGSGRDYMPRSTTDPNFLFDPSRLDSVRHAADNIIKEKDQIIDRQKLAIIQLEQQGKASEAEMARTMLKKTKGEMDILRLKLQEQEYQNSRLKDRLAEVTTGGTETRSTLERKLGEVEFNLQQLTLTKEQEVQDRDAQILKLQKKIGELEMSVTMWKDRYGDVQTTCSELQEKKASLERYIQDMPTQDERMMTKTKMSTLELELEKERGRVYDLEKQVTEIRRNISARDALIHTLEKCNSEKEELILQLKDEQSALTVEVQRLRGDGPPPEDDVEELKYKNTRLQADLDKARKLLESHERQKRESLRRRDSESRELSQRLEQEEATVQALRAEVTAKDSELKRAMLINKKLNKQKQEHLEKTVALEERLSALSATGDVAGKEEVRKLERRLMVELSVCFSELQSLVDICVQKADGHDPNISALLGARASTSGNLAGDPGVEDTLQSLKYRVGKVRELRDDLDRLRDIMSTKFAEDMGENLNCATQ